MKRLLGPLLVLATLSLAACGDDDDGSSTATSNGGKDVSDVLALTGDSVAGKDVYDRSCSQSTCHGPDGDSGQSSSPPLSVEVPKRSNQELAIVIRFGTIDEGGIMPKTEATAQEIADVIAFLRETFK